MAASKVTRKLQVVFCVSVTLEKKAMKVEIWSDVMCPFCYIGKRHFEAALSQLNFAADLDVEWKSFQLNPEYHNTTQQTVYGYLAENKGISESQAREMTGQVSNMGRAAGLELDFETSIPANSFNAHRVIHLAAANGLQDQAEEAFFKAHFMEGKDVADAGVLLSIGSAIGIAEDAVREVLDTDSFADAVRRDVYEAQQLGIRGVPYFVMDRKYGLSGAQPVEAFKQALAQSYNEWKSRQPETGLQQLGSAGQACDEDGCAI